MLQAQEFLASQKRRNLEEPTTLSKVMRAVDDFAGAVDDFALFGRSMGLSKAVELQVNLVLLL